MSLQDIYHELLAYRLPILIAIFLLPWLTFGICYLIPGRKEEPYVLSVNLGVSLLLTICWIIYLVYAFGRGGVSVLVEEADFVLLLFPVYHLSISLFLSRKRIPLEQIPAYRFMKGLGIISVAFLVLMWIASKIRILFFSFLPFSTFLYIVGALVLFGLMGIRYLRRKRS